MKSEALPTFAFSMQEEGGAALSLDPADNGNWTAGSRGQGALIGSKYGVSAPDLVAYMRPRQCTSATMAGLTENVAEAIWSPGYWQAMRGDDLPAGFGIANVDYGYNAGVHTAGRVLQSLLGFTGDDLDGWVGDQTLAALSKSLAARQVTVPHLSTYAATALQGALGLPADGVIGPVSTRAILAHPAARSLVLLAQLADAQAATYRTFAQFDTYGNGWLARTWRRAAASMAMAVAATSTTGVAK